MSGWSVYLFWFLVLLVPYAHADELGRSVSLELTPIAGASVYEIELRSSRTKEVLLFQTQTPNWTAEIQPGSYKLRFRALDERQVPSVWSRGEDLVVRVRAPQILSPQENATVLLRSDQNTNVQFQWLPSLGAKTYVLLVEPGHIQIPTPQTSLTVRFPAGGNYRWKVTSVGEGNEAGEDAKFQKISILNSPILPVIPPPSSGSGRNFEKEKKYFYLGFGPTLPVVTNGLASTGLTTPKANVEFAFVQAVGEHLGYLIFYNANINPENFGKSEVVTLGLGVHYFIQDRLASASSFFRADLGYGGSNRFEDGGASAGIGWGWQFGRNGALSPEIILRYQVVFTPNAGPLSPNPSLAQARFGFIF